MKEKGVSRYKGWYAFEMERMYAYPGDQDLSGEIILYTMLLKNIPPQPLLSSGPKAVFNLFLPCKLSGGPTICAPSAPPALSLVSLSCIYLLNACCGQDEAVHCVHTPYCTFAGYSRNKTDTGATKPRERRTAVKHTDGKKCNYSLR